MKEINSTEAPLPNGHYSQAIEANGLIFVSAQLPIDPHSSQMPDHPVEQARVAIANCRAILVAAHSELEHVLSASIYVTDLELWPEINDVWAEALGSHRPARAVLGVHRLHLGASVAIQLIAAQPMSVGAIEDHRTSAEEAARRGGQLHPS